MVGLFSGKCLLTNLINVLVGLMIFEVFGALSTSASSELEVEWNWVPVSSLELDDTGLFVWFHFMRLIVTANAKMLSADCQLRKCIE